MYCPSCGKTNSTEQKYCRSCGLALEESARSLILQKGDADLSLEGRTKLVEKALTILGGLGLSAFLITIIGTIVVKMIIEKGHVVSGIAFITFILLAVTMLALVVYRESLLDDAKKNPHVKDITVPDDEPLQIASPHFEPVPSVTERTTNLLTVDRPKYKTSELD